MMGSQRSNIVDDPRVLANPSNSAQLMSSVIAYGLTFPRS